MQKFISYPSSSDAMDSYVKALEEERKKILVFERELPFSLQLVTQAIESCQRKHQHHIVGSEEITSEGGVYPVLEEFIPLRPTNSNLSSSEEEEDSRRQDKSYGNGDSKPDWLRSVQLWNQEPDPPIPTPRVEEVEEEPVLLLHKPIPFTRVGAFHPFEKEKNLKGPAAPVSSTILDNNNNNNNNNNNGKEEREKEEGQSSQRKARRCWSPELHRRFLHALNQLGGSHAATPKQIRELMKVDGLTNDEVKSHLQKYRLHTRRQTTGAVQSSSSSSTQPHQIVLVGGLWLPTPEYNAAQPTTDAVGAQPFNGNGNGNGIYAPPVASLPSELGSEQLQKMKQQSKGSPTGPLKSEGRSIGDNNSDGERTNSDSSATASSLSSHR